MKQVSAGAVVLAALLFAGVLSATMLAGAEELASWDAKAAAAYMDSRQAWWRSWPSAARDHETVCVSCHSALPYALARPALRSALAEHGPSTNESKLLADVVMRVRAWKDMEPWYPDQTRGLPKTAESRGTESVINAAVLARRDAETGTLSDDARQALANMWAQQMRTGDLSGAWAWLSFRLEPWEGARSAYFGAALAAIAVGTAPGGYASSAGIEKNVELLRGYLRKQAGEQHTLNKLMLLWASAKLDGLLTAEERAAILTEVVGKRRGDGGWSTATLGPFQRVDGSSPDTSSDGYATGLAVYALQQAGVPASNGAVQPGLRWLVEHQDKTTGRWLASSLNKAREPESDPGRFMNDVATAYAVLALTSTP
jgi:squalene-hopene/tetraprenyl-beta-curcumene cyclase